MTTLEEKQIEKTTAILDASLKLFSENGFHATPMSLIASTANVGAGTIYRYYKNKDDLINELYKKTKKKMIDYVSVGFEEDTSLKDVFYRIWARTIEFCVNNPKEILFLEQFANTPFISTETKNEILTFFEPLHELYANAVKNKEVEDIPIDIIKASLQGTTVTLFKMSMAGDLELTHELIKQSFETFWKGIKK